jgi:hypothetical protein
MNSSDHARRFKPPVGLKMCKACGIYPISVRHKCKQSNADGMANSAVCPPREPPSHQANTPTDSGV